MLPARRVALQPAPDYDPPRARPASQVDLEAQLDQALGELTAATTRRERYEALERLLDLIKSRPSAEIARLELERLARARRIIP